MYTVPLLVVTIGNMMSILLLLLLNSATLRNIWEL